MKAKIVEFKDGRYGVRKWFWTKFKFMYFCESNHHWGESSDVKREPYFSGYRFLTFDHVKNVCDRVNVKQVSI